jgi:hypothetical protein
VYSYTLHWLCNAYKMLQETTLLQYGLLQMGGACGDVHNHIAVCALDL